jgi:hypothetical protein
MVDNFRDRSKAEHSHKAHPTRAGSMGKTHLTKIVEAVRRIAAKPLILRALTYKPVLPVHEYLDRTEAQDDRHGSLSRGLKEHDAGVTTSPSASRGNAKFTRSDHFLAVRNHDVATRSPLWDRTAPLGPTISIRDRDLVCESARALKRQELAGLRDHRTAQHQWVTFGDSSSSGKESEALLRRASQPNNSGEKPIPLVASRESGTSMGLESGGLGKTIKRLTYIWERLSELKQAAHQLDAINTGTLSGGSDGMAIAPTKRLLAGNNLGAERANRHGGERDKSESSRSRFGVIVKCCGSAGHDQAAFLGWLSLE